MKGRGFESRIHRRKPKGGTMPLATSRANDRQSRMRSAAGDDFARQKVRVGPVIRTIGLPRACSAITLANIACNMRRLVWLTGAKPVA